MNIKEKEGEENGSEGKERKRLKWKGREKKTEEKREEEISIDGMRREEERCV